MGGGDPGGRRGRLYTAGWLSWKLLGASDSVIIVTGDWIVDGGGAGGVYVLVVDERVRSSPAQCACWQCQP